MVCYALEFGFLATCSGCWLLLTCPVISHQLMFVLLHFILGVIFVFIVVGHRDRCPLWGVYSYGFKFIFVSKNRSCSDSEMNWDESSLSELVWWWSYALSSDVSQTDMVSSCHRPHPGSNVGLTLVANFLSEWRMLVLGRGSRHWFPLPPPPLRLTYWDFIWSKGLVGGPHFLITHTYIHAYIQLFGEECTFIF